MLSHPKPRSTVSCSRRDRHTHRGRKRVFTIRALVREKSFPAHYWSNRRYQTHARKGDYYGPKFQRSCLVLLCSIYYDTRNQNVPSFPYLLLLRPNFIFIDNNNNSGREFIRQVPIVTLTVTWYMIPSASSIIRTVGGHWRTSEIKLKRQL